MVTLETTFRKARKEHISALATANARVAEQQKPSYKAEFDCVYEKLKAEERLSAHYKQKVEQAEAKLNETYTDENGTVWTRPTAEAYCLICKAYDAWKTKAEQAEAQCSELKKANSDLASAAIEKPLYKADLLEENRRMRDTLEQIAKMLYYDEKSELAEEALKGGK